MPISMTGFGQSAKEVSFGQVCFEIQSVNRKHLEMSFHLPKDFSYLELTFRKMISSLVFRGQVTVRMNLNYSKKGLSYFLPDLETLKGVKEAWVKLSQDAGLNVSSVDLPFLVERLPHSSKKGFFQEQDVGLIEEALKEAAIQMIEVKKNEGRALSIDLQMRMNEVEKLSQSIDELSLAFTDKIRKKLTEKLETLFPKDQEIDERVLKEVALLAEKGDITEELIRLKSHFHQFYEAFKLDGAVGRKMEFILQEISREINTIGSKAQDSKISHAVIEMKAEIERVREQLQNIE